MKYSRAIGRPSIYNDEMVDRALKYLNGGWAKVGDAVPTIAGMACELGVNRETLRLWSKDEDNAFFGILDGVMQEQERKLVNGGLLGEFNPNIAKMMLTKHGYLDKSEISTPDGNPLVVQYQLPSNGRDE